MRTIGISPKVIASAITGVIVYLVTKLGLQLDPVIEQAINVAAMILAGYIAPSGQVEDPPVPVGEDGNPVLPEAA
jgi:hypothetical protein